MRMMSSAKIVVPALVAAAAWAGWNLSASLADTKLAPASGAKTLAPLPPVPIPKDNPQTPEKIELGRMLYFDPRLAGDSSISCAKCHDPEKGFSNGTQLSDAYPGTKHWRHAPTVLNAAYATAHFWDGRAGSLEEQCLGPVQAPIEMNQNMGHLVQKLENIPAYQQAFKKVFGTEVTADSMAKAIAAFERTIVSQPGPVDRFLLGDKSALNTSQLRGMEIFTGKANCIACHNGPLLSDNDFHATGVPEIEPLKTESDRIATRHFYAADQKYPNPKNVNSDLGREFITKSAADRAKFKTPSLREVVYTAPYMHNGAFETLDEVIEFYEKGGGDIPGKDPLLKPFSLSNPEKEDLVAFIESLSSPSLPKPTKPDLPRKSDGTF